MTRVIALVGPPAAGKSTVMNMLSDFDVPSYSTGDAVRSATEQRIDDPSEDDYWETAEQLREEHGPEGPTVACANWIDARTSDLICVADQRAQAEIDWLRENVGPTLVINVDAPSHQRTKRYVERELDGKHEPVNSEVVSDLREELYDREIREMPYPTHDLTLWNSDSVSMSEVWHKLDNLMTFVRSE